MAAKVESDADKPNTVDPERLKKEIVRIEDALAAKLSHKMQYVERCKPFNEAVANAYEIAATTCGVSKKVFKALITQRELQRKIDDVPEQFEDETRETFDMVCQALGDFGDLPLGQAAKTRAAAAEERNVSLAPAKPRGRPRKAPSPDAALATAAAASKPAASSAGPDTISEAYDPDNAICQAGYAARKKGDGCAIPAEIEGDDRDLWHSGWLAADADVAAGDANAERLRSGISPLH